MDDVKEVKKEYFTVKIDVIAPVTLAYRIYAEGPNEAIEIAKKLGRQQLSAPPAVTWGGVRRVKAIVYNAGSSLIRLAKTIS